MIRLTKQFLLFISLFMCLSFAWAAQSGVDDKTKQLWQMLDYLAVDYSGAVKDGQIASKDEYAEMVEFSHSAQQQIQALPDKADKPRLLQQAQQLKQLIADKAAPAAVSEQARNLAANLIAAYPIPLAPAKLPDFKLGAQTYQAQCASCHGTSGKADGPLAAKLNPPPINFTDHDRARERSLLSLYQTITRGVEGTSMPSFAALTDEERWSLAFYISTLAYSNQDIEAGAKRWETNAALKGAIPDISALTQASEATLAKQLEPAAAREVLAYLRSHPDHAQASQNDSLSLAKSRLNDSIGMLDKGERAQASKLAISAYLDGFEPVEPALAVKNRELFETVERNMGLFRAAVNEGNLDRAKELQVQLQAQLSQAQATLSAAEDSPLATFLGALTILLREGLEALLVVIAMIAFLKKAERTEVLPYIHAGWLSALAAGGLTWGVATYIVDISGASREITEGFAALFAAVVLLTVGVWMHQKSLAGRWQAYIRDKLSHALSKQSVTVLFLLSFITVYREVFETVLFYAAMWNELNGVYLLAGLGTGIVILALIAAVMLRTSARLPIGKFFAVSSALVAVLAVVLTGKGIAALQEAGIFNLTPVALPRIDLLGIYPSQQTLLGQFLMLAIIVGSFGWNLRSKPARI